jgi:Nucleoside-diphosphate-sugar epimerases
MRILKLTGLSSASAFFATVATNAPKKVAVFGGTGYVGSAVCERLIQKGHDVTAISRRGTNPRPGDANLDQVNWVKGDATDPATVKGFVKDADAVVHAIGLLFDVNSGLANFNTIVSGSKSLPGENSTYDAITRQTMFNVCDAIEEKNAFPKIGKQEKFPLCFVSAAEAGWPEVSGGSFVEEKFAPDWLKRYLAAKRVVEDRLKKSDKIRGVIYRPSLIWDWTKVRQVVVYDFFCHIAL